MSDRYTNFTASFNGAGLTCKQIGGANFDAGQSLNEYIADGALDRSAVILNSARPVYRVPSRDLTNIFGTLSPTVGYNCTSSSVFRLQQRAAGGTFSGSTSNVTVTSALGFLCPGTLAASGDQPASLDMIYYALSSTGAGADPPIVMANSVDFTSVTAPTHNSTFYLGPVYANSSAMAGLQSASVDFGLNVSMYMHSGAVFPTECSITSRTPRVRLTFTKADMIYTLTSGVFNTSLPGTFALYFRKGTAGGSRVADATTSHCKVSFSTGVYMPNSIQVSGETDATISYDVIPTGSVSISVASAIP